MNNLEKSLVVVLREQLPDNSLESILLIAEEVANKTRERDSVDALGDLFSNNESDEIPGWFDTGYMDNTLHINNNVEPFIDCKCDLETALQTIAEELKSNAILFDLYQTKLFDVIKSNMMSKWNGRKIFQENADKIANEASFEFWNDFIKDVKKE